VNKGPSWPLSLPMQCSLFLKRHSWLELRVHRDSPQQQPDRSNRDKNRRNRPRHRHPHRRNGESLNLILHRRRPQPVTGAPDRDSADYWVGYFQVREEGNGEACAEETG